MDMTLPRWLRGVVLISALMQLGFGVTLLVDPSRIAEVWPWAMPPLTTRVLAASTLVSVPLALLSVCFNRYSAAVIPLVMLASYRVLQLAAGALHTERFGGNVWLTANYFGGGSLMLVVFLCALWAGQTMRLPRSIGTGRFAARMPWTPASGLRPALMITGILYIALGVNFFINAEHAAQFWIDARGITPLTARLLSSPLSGLGLGLCLVARASDWRMVAIPATGMIAIGIIVVFALILGRADFAPTTWIGWLVAASPVTLLAAGVAILVSKPMTDATASQTVAA